VEAARCSVSSDPRPAGRLHTLRTTEAKYASMIGQFVGVKGAVTTDTALNMKIIDQPTATEPVDIAKVNNSVAAQIIPPSLVPGLHARNVDGLRVGLRVGERSVPQV